MFILLLAVLCFLLLPHIVKSLRLRKDPTNVPENKITVIEKKPPLPPSTMSWSCLGKTFQLYSASDPKVFFSQKVERYGPIFKSPVCKVAMFTLCVAVSSIYNKPRIFLPSTGGYNRALYLTYCINQSVMVPIGFFAAVVLLIIGVSVTAPPENLQQHPSFISLSFKELLTNLTLLVGIIILLIGGAFAVVGDWLVGEPVELRAM